MTDLLSPERATGKRTAPPKAWVNRFEVLAVPGKQVLQGGEIIPPGVYDDDVILPSRETAEHYAIEWLRSLDPITRAMHLWLGAFPIEEGA